MNEGRKEYFGLTLLGWDRFFCHQREFSEDWKASLGMGYSQQPCVQLWHCMVRFVKFKNWFQRTSDDTFRGVVGGCFLPGRRMLARTEDRGVS